MNKTKQKMLEKKGWKVGTVEEFLWVVPSRITVYRVEVFVE